jgi:hypothetical protein
MVVTLGQYLVGKANALSLVLAYHRGIYLGT